MQPLLFIMNNVGAINPITTVLYDYQMIAKFLDPW